MCGIVGCVGSIYAKEETAFQIMCKLDTIRGEDSTGVCSVTKDVGDWSTLKDILTPFDLFRDSEFIKMMKRHSAMLFGHNRAATRGSVTVDNAHPFRQGDFIGCHNGTLNAVWDLKDSKKFKVDSEAIFHNMAVEGVAETIKKLNGAFALCWYNAALHTVNLVRNDDRPMHYCYTKDHKTMFWASESWMIHVALEKVNIPRGEIMQLGVGKWLTVEVPKVAGVNVEKVEDAQQDVELYKIPEYKGVQNYFPSYNGKSNNEKPTDIFKIKNRWKKANLSSRFLGKEITFSVVGKRKRGNLDYILCDVEDYASPPDLRIFTPFDGKLGIMLIDSLSLFKGKVKSCSVYNDGAYLVCDNRTIVQIDDEIALQGELDSPEIMLDIISATPSGGYTNNTISLHKYLELTSKGCACCGEIPNAKSAQDLLWVSSDDFFCKDCKNTNLAVQYIALANG